MDKIGKKRLAAAYGVSLEELDKMIERQLSKLKSLSVGGKKLKSAKK